MTRAAICLAVLTGFAALADIAKPDAGDGLDEVMRALAARRHGAADFVEQRFLSLVKRPVESSGELIFDAPDRLEKRTLEPHAESLRVEGGKLTLERGNHQRVVELQSYPQALPFIDSIRATLAGNRAALERDYRLAFSGTLAHWTLALTPRDAGLARSVAKVRIDGAQDDLLKVEIAQPDGDRSLMTLRPHTGR